MIKTIIRLQNDMVFVFDRNGEQSPEYQGQYEAVKESILRDAPSDTLFHHIPDNVLREVTRDKW